MQDTAVNSKRIAKNTLLLYFRMLFLMLISLYTSRVILDALGVEDYGIYNVVGGFVAMFTILCGSMSTAISRFITFELGRKDTNRLSSVFSTSVTIQLIMAIIITIIAEIVGVWFINTKLVIPENRLYAANWVYQFSVITFVINLISVPYNAAIIAHEKMSAFAYISIYEGMARLLIALLIVHSPFDRLIFFALCIAVVQLSIRFIYSIYCKHHFDECIYHFFFEKGLLKEMLGFAGWTFIGSSAIHLRDQGGNILINLFFGPTVNAASGIAMKVNTVVQQFVVNFMMALNPQITKNYAKGDYEYMFKLMFVGARFSYYLMLIISLPFIICTDYILNIWLKEVPEYSTTFAKLFLILAMSDCLSNPITVAQSATGVIRNYQIVVGGMLFLNLPVVYIVFMMGFHPAASVVVAIVISQISLFLRLYMFKKRVAFSVKSFFRKVYTNVISVSIVACVPPVLVFIFLPQLYLSKLFVCFLAILSSILSVGFIGCNYDERILLYSKFRKFFISKLIIEKEPNK